jgi:hypothetical protein
MRADTAARHPKWSTASPATQERPEPGRRTSQPANSPTHQLHAALRAAYCPLILNVVTALPPTAETTVAV